MKNLTHHAILITSLLVGTSIPLYAQQDYQQSQSGSDLSETNEWMKEHHGGKRHQWKAFKEEMAAEIKTQDQELEQLATQMTNSPPAQKLDAVSAVVGKLVEDRLTLHRKLEAMHEQMHGTNAPMDTNSSSLPPTPGSQ